MANLSYRSGLKLRVREARSELCLKGELSAERARAYFFSFIVEIAAAVFLSIRHQPYETGRPGEVLEHLLGSESGLGSADPLVREKGEFCLWFAGEEWKKLVIENPTAIGWAYQFWNEADRDGTTWAISRSDTDGLDGLNISLATQLYTEEYMTRYLLECTVENFNLSPLSFSLLDPACGSGHFLVQCIRTLREQKAFDALELIMRGGLCGIDIDTFAVRLCRLIVWIEAMRDAQCREQSREAFQALSKFIIDLPAPLGTLDRSVGGNIISRKYSAVATNPPFVGRRKMNLQLRNFLDREYPAASSDLCTAFIMRSLELLESGGVLALVTVDKWLRLKCYSALRNGAAHFKGIFGETQISTLVELGERAFGSDVELHDGVGVLMLAARLGTPLADHSFSYLDLSSFRNLKDKVFALERNGAEADSNVEGLKKQVLQGDLREESCVASLASAGGLPSILLDTTKSVGTCARVVVGIQTNDDRRFVKYQWMVPAGTEGWLPHSKGGGYGRWYGFNRFLLNVEKYESYNSPGHFETSNGWFSKQGWTYTWFANGCLGLRRKEVGWSFGRAAASGLFCEDDRVIAYLNSRLGSFLVRKLGRKIQLPEGIVKKLPLPPSLDFINPLLIDAAVKLKSLLVSQDPTEISFAPRTLISSFSELRLQALLLVAEGQLEAQAVCASNLDSAGQKTLSAAIGFPVAWYPHVLSVLELSKFWNEVEPSFRFLCDDTAELEFSMMEKEHRSRTDLEDGLKDLILSKKRNQKKDLHNQLPTTCALEKYCRSMRVHPVDLYLLLAECSTSSKEFATELNTRSINRSLLVGVLDSFGHHWRSEGVTARNISEPLRELDIARRLEEHCHCSLQKKLDNACLETLLGNSITSWLEKKFMPAHNQEFLGFPLITRGDDGRYAHAWDRRKVV